METHVVGEHREHEEPRWPGWLALLALGALTIVLPRELLVAGNPWLVLVVVAALLVPTAVFHFRGHDLLNRVFGIVVNLVVTGSVLYSLIVLIVRLSENAAPAILSSGAALWISNILVFASWYWRLDAGGPGARDARRRKGTPHHAEGGFLFPQMMMRDTHARWSPHFVDYLFLAFTTSTAFSPTDTAPLSRWAKAGMMVQSLISLLLVVVVASRALALLDAPALGPK